MKFALRIATMTVVLMLLVSVATAGPPLSNTYKSSDIGGVIDPARSSTSWLPSEMVVDNVTHIRSVDLATVGAATFTGMWSVDCVVIAGVNLVIDLTFFGSGQIIWQLDYAGGTMTLDGAAAWGNGDASYTVILDSFTEIRTQSFVSGVMTGANSNFSGSGTFLGYPSDCLNLGQANDVWIGDGAGKPADYPAFLDALCGTTPTNGRWGIVTGVTIDITSGCAIPIENTTWGGVKSIYRD